MRKKVRRALAILLAIAIAVSVMSGMALSASAGSDAGAETTPSAAADETQTEQTNANNNKQKDETDQTDQSQATDQKTAAQDKQSTKDAAQTDDTAKQSAQTTPASAASASSSSAEDPVEPAAPVLQQQTIRAVVSDHSAVITLSGKLPADASAKASPVKVSLDNMKVLAAYDITIYDADGAKFEPDAANPIQVTLQDASLKNAKDVSIYHMANKNATPQRVEKDVSVKSNAVTFDAKSFSIYVVGTHYTHTYTFLNGSTTYNTQILSTGEKLSEPESPTKEGYVFQGWYTAATGGTKFTSWDTEGSLSANQTTTLYAQFAKIYYVFYKAGNTTDSKVLYTQKYTTDGSTIDPSPVNNLYKTDSVDKALIGWSTNKDATTPDTNLTINGADVTLYPVVAAAHWITYDSKGGSIINPAYVLANKTTTAPTNPTRKGYTFGGWYTDSACTTKFTFGSALTSNITLYAKWTPASTTYTVAYWLENANDTNYTFKESVSKTGTTGAAATYDSKSYPYFTFKKADSTTIKADGSTIVNVYYARNVYTLTFQKDNGDWRHSNWTTVATIQAKYGANISSKWPVVGTDGTKYDGWVWEDTGNTFSYILVALEEMPGANVTFHGENRGTSKTIYYYVEVLPGESYTKAYNGKYFKLYKSIPNGYNFVTYDEDFFPIQGFDRYGSSGTFHNKEARFSNNQFSFYYSRTSYTLTFYNVNQTDKSESVLYEASLEDQNYTPSRPSGIPSYYAFKGWYTTAECYDDSAFNFTGAKMPAGNLILYAKWAPNDVTVSFDSNGGSSVSDQTFAAGNTVNKPADPTRTDYKFAGWTYQDGTPFNFNTEITADTTLYAQWVYANQFTVTYDANGGTGTVTDTNGYDPNASAKAKSGSDLTPPSDKVGFVCWNTKKDGTGASYYPGDSFKVTGNMTLYAQWAPIRKTTLTYNYNYSGAPAAKTVDIETPNEKTTIDETNPTREGYKFIGWTIKQDGTGTKLQKGDQVQVDTLNPETNILYAQWKKEITVTVQKDVTGNMGETDKAFSFTTTGATPASFTLKDKDQNPDSKQIFTLAEGDSITITEGSYDGYTTSYSVDDAASVNSNSYTLTVGESTKDVSIVFTNYKQITPPNGLISNVAPYVAMIGVAAGAGIGYVVMRRRRNSDEN